MLLIALMTVPISEAYVRKQDKGEARGGGQEGRERLQARVDGVGYLSFFDSLIFHIILFPIICYFLLKAFSSIHNTLSAEQCYP